MKKKIWFTGKGKIDQIIRSKTFMVHMLRENKQYLEFSKEVLKISFLFHHLPLFPPINTVNFFTKVLEFIT